MDQRELLLKESFKWIEFQITSFPSQTTNLDIPLHLLEFWLEPDPSDEPDTEDDRGSWTVFLYAYLRYIRDVKKLTQTSPSIEELESRFTDWIVLLSTAIISKKTDVKVGALKLFYFEPRGEEKINIS